MVPQFRPQSAQRLLSNLLTGDRFAELIPTDEELAAFTDDEFNAWIDKWTVAAKKNVEKTELDEKPYLKKEIIYS